MTKKICFLFVIFCCKLSYNSFSQNPISSIDTINNKISTETSELLLKKNEKNLKLDSNKSQKIIKIIVDGKEISPSVEIKKTPKLETDLLPPPLPEKNSLAEKIRLTDSINAELKKQELLAKEKAEAEKIRISDSINIELKKQEQLANEKTIAENKLLAEAEAKRIAEKQQEEQQNKNAKEAENTLLVNNQKADSSAKVQNDLLKEQSKIDAPAQNLKS